MLADKAAGQMQVVDISGLLLYSCDYVKTTFLVGDNWLCHWQESMRFAVGAAGESE